MIAVLVIVIIVMLAVLLTIAGVTWAVRTELVFAPTPTPTATPGTPFPPTPDFRATRMVEDMLTQEAYASAIGFATPAVVQPQPSRVAMLPIVGAPGDSTPPAITPAPTPTTSEILLPVVSNPGQTATAPPTPTPVQPISNIVTTSPPPTPTFTPTFTPVPPTVTPTPTPQRLSPTPTATPIARVPELRAQVIRSGGAIMHAGPSTLYTAKGSLPQGTEIRLQGRTESGEWVYGCCAPGDNSQFWIRQADAPPAGNDLGEAIPTSESPDDVRWLGVTPLNPTLTPMPSPSPIPVADYPLYRREPSNRGEVARLPRPPIQRGWQPYLPGGVFSSPVVVAGMDALASSTDNHLYSVDRVGGNQRWRTTLEGVVRQAAAVIDDNVYLADEQGRLYNLVTQADQQRWRVDMGGMPISGVNVVDKYLLIGVDVGGQHRLMMFDRGNGTRVAQFSTEGTSLQYPAVGDQLVYVANSDVWALDVFGALTQVWQYTNLDNITAPPVYARPGVRATAELYVADGIGRVASLDANTGRELWVYQSGDVITGMAVDDERLFLSGNGFVKAISRQDRTDLWRVLTDGNVLGGPIVGDGEVFVVTETGDVRYLDAEDGGQILVESGPATTVGPGVVAGDWIFLVGQEGIYGFRGAE
jgi:outer membrane protein assembly factor BamB